MTVVSEELPVTHDSGSGMPMSERMQSLLSRAVEDQQSDQRSIAGALADVRAQIEQLARDVAAGREQPAAQDAAAVGALTVELRESMRRTGDRLDTVARMVAQRGEDIATLQSALSLLSEQLRVQSDTVTGLAGSVDGVGAHLNGIATYLNERARDDGTRIVGIEQRLVTLQNDMTAVGGHVAGLTDSTARGSEELDARIRSIVAGALVGTERRLAAHMDDAVLALAEAMLRRRPTGRDAATADQLPAEPPPTEQPQVEQPQAEQPQVEQPQVEQPATEQLQSAAPPVAEPQPVAVADLPPAPVVQPPAAPALDPITTLAQPTASPASLPDDGPPSQAPAEDLAAASAPEVTVDLTETAVPANTVSSGSAANDSAANSSATGHSGNGSVPKVPAAWTTVMPDDDQRRRGWFRSRE
jgi:hypothetical protein